MTGLTVTTPNDRDIVVTRFFRAPPALVFDAHTRPELVRRWQSGPDGWDWLVCEIDLKVGGAYRYRWRHADGREIGFRGLYREITPPHGYVHTEVFEEDPSGGEVVGTVRFVGQEGGTLMTYTMRAPSA
ncbi:MAG TPA: SRPBCC domain-containing protein, partial [Rhizomicrobium sp.]